MNRTFAITGIMGVLLILGIALGVYYYRYTMQVAAEAQRAQFKVAYEAFEAPHHAGNVDESIPIARQLILDAPSPSWEAKAKILLAYDLFVRNQGEDRKEAYAIYKAAASNENVTPLFRALALADMAFTIQMSGDESLARIYIFNDLPYSQLLTDAGGNVNIALRRVYELSDSMYPNAFAKIQIALLYGQQLTSGEIMTEPMREETAQLIQKSLKDADPLLVGFPYEGGKMAQLYLSRAVALWTSSSVLHNVGLDELQAAQNKVIKTANEAGDVHGKMVANLARLFSAIVLYTETGVTREDELREMLKSLALEVTSATDFSRDSTMGYLGGIAQRPESNVIKKQIAALAGISPEFKVLLQQSGWVI